jgi:hypothetical protein
MLKSLAVKLAGLGAAGLVAGAVMAHPAGAFVIKNPICNSGPYIAPAISPSDSITGACFGPEISVSVMFNLEDGPPKIETTRASSTGMILVPYWPYPLEGSYIQAIEANGVGSNLLFIEDQ